MDGRFVTKKFGFALTEKAQKLALKRQYVVDFLQELYEQSAEPLPTVSGKKGPGDGFLKFKRQRGRRPNHFWVRERQQRAARSAGRSEMRYLPPGSFADYYELFKARLAQQGQDTVGIRVFKTAAWPSKRIPVTSVSSIEEYRK